MKALKYLGNLYASVRSGRRRGEGEGEEGGKKKIARGARVYAHAMEKYRDEKINSAVVEGDLMKREEMLTALTTSL